MTSLDSLCYKDFIMIIHGVGICRYPRFKRGQIVELSQHGYNAGLADYHASVFGTVVDMTNGILTVRREGMDRDQEFHPCYWLPSSKREKHAMEEWQKQRWLDHAEWDGLG